MSALDIFSEDDFFSEPMQNSYCKIASLVEISVTCERISQLQLWFISQDDHGQL
jgi:hypothetical protein